MHTILPRLFRLPLALAALACPIAGALLASEALAQITTPIEIPTASRKSSSATLPPPVTESERRFRDLSDYIRARGELDANTRSDAARIAEQLDADLANQGNPIPTTVRLLAARVQTAIWLDDRDAMNKSFERLVAFQANKDSALLAWARELLNCAEFDRALEVLAKHNFAADRAVDARILLAQCYIAANRYDEAQAAINSAPMQRSTNQLSQIAQTTGRVTALRGLWNAEMVAMAKDQARGDLPLVEFVTTKGPVTIELFEDQAPNTVGNFIEHVEAGTYNGTRFHRLLRGYGVQGGDPATATGGAGGASSGGWTIPDETLSDAKRAPLIGRLIMASQPDPAVAPAPKMNSAGCQFMVLLTQAEQFVGQYTVFGRVTDGLDVVRQLTVDDTVVSARVARKRNHEYKGVRFSTDASGDFSMPRAPGETTRALETKIQKPQPPAAPSSPAGPQGAPKPQPATPAPIPIKPVGATPNSPLFPGSQSPSQNPNSKNPNSQNPNSQNPNSKNPNSKSPMVPTPPPLLAPNAPVPAPK